MKAAEKSRIPVLTTDRVSCDQNENQPTRRVAFAARASAFLAPSDTAAVESTSTTGCMGAAAVMNT